MSNKPAYRPKSTPLGTSYAARENQVAFLGMFLETVGEITVRRDPRDTYLLFTPKAALPAKQPVQRQECEGRTYQVNG